MTALLADMSTMISSTITALNSMVSGTVTAPQILLTGFAGIVGVGVVGRFFGLMR